MPYIRKGTQSGLRRMTNSKKSNQIPKEINRCRKDEPYQQTQSWPYIIDPWSTRPECELRHSHAMTVKHPITDCASLASLGLRFFVGSNRNTLKQILRRNKVNSNLLEFLKESNIYNRA